jgi:alkylation response protein AidB-like acyl-CoA dehydrogenase
MRARAFARAEIAPISLRADQIRDPAATWNWDVIEKGSRLGFRTAAVPKAYGGAELDLVTQCLIVAEMAKADSAVAKVFSQSWKWCNLVAEFCAPEQRTKIFKAFLEDDRYMLGGGITEPDAGSDNRLAQRGQPRAGLRLQARRDGDDWVLDGGKCFIANGGVAKLFFAYVRTDPSVPVHEGTSIFAIPADAPGFRIGKIFNKNGWRLYQNAELIFDNVRVPQSSLVGELNGGFRTHGGKTGKFIDLEYAANAVGVCDGAVAMAMDHVRDRWPGQTYLDNQTIQLKLSEMHMLTEALRSYVMRVAGEGDADPGPVGPHSLFLMNFSSDAIQRVCNLNMAIHASSPEGWRSARAEKLVRDAIIWTHIGGDSVQRMKAIRHLFDVEARASGATPHVFQ